MVINNKSGLIRILEATIAIMIVAGVLLVTYSTQQSAESDSREYIYNMQKRILEDISLRDDLRNAALQSTDGEVNPILIEYVETQIQTDLFGYVLRVCNLETPMPPCKMTVEDFVLAGNADVYVEETLISANLSEYDPKKVRLFIWEKI